MNSIQILHSELTPLSQAQIRPTNQLAHLRGFPSSTNAVLGRPGKTVPARCSESTRPPLKHWWISDLLGDKNDMKT